MKIISSNEAPAAIGPYSQGIVVGNLLFVSGQIPVCPLNETIPEGIEAQAEQSCKNVNAIVTKSGASMSDVVKTTCYIANMEDFSKFNEVYSKYFVSKPARSCVAVKTLPKNVLCEIEAIVELK